MAFYAIEIDACIAFGFTGGPEFHTNIQPLANGREKRNADWDWCRHKYTLPFKNIEEASDYAAIRAVFVICRGSAHTFLFRDPTDYEVDSERFGTGDGTTKAFQLKKVSTVPGTTATYERVITKPINPRIYVDGVLTAATVSPTSGIVMFGTAPAAGAVLTWSGEFRVHVRFDLDYLPFSLDALFADGKRARNGSVDLIEVLGETDDAT